MIACSLPSLVLVVVGYVNADTTLIFLSLGLMAIFIYVLLSHEIAKVAKEKGRSYSAFFVLSLLFSPIVMGIIAATVSPLSGSRRYVPLVVRNESPTSSSEVDQIEKLGNLLAKGLITEAEFQEKKAKLLDRL